MEALKELVEAVDDAGYPTIIEVGETDKRLMRAMQNIDLVKEELRKLIEDRNAKEGPWVGMPN